MVKVHAKVQAKKLRGAGHSYNYIARALEVSKSTLSLWLADVPYTPNTETILRIGKARAASGEAKSRIKRESIERARKEARAELGRLSKRDLFMLGLGLYIGEGSKSDPMARFVNSDPAAVCIMIRWFTEALGLGKRNLRLRAHLYPDSNEERSLQYWSRMTTIPRSQFYKTSVDRRTNKRAFKEGKLPNGTVHLIVHSLGEKRFGVFLSRKIAAWSEQVLRTTNAGLV